jgi:ABC transport system ATP-binding/permease protein
MTSLFFAPVNSYFCTLTKTDYMTPFIQAENLLKRFGDLLLFKDISFTIFSGQKVALIAKNGAGKTTLLRLLVGLEKPDEGQITITNGVRIGYFEQSPELNPDNTIIEEIFDSGNEKLAAIKQFELAVAHNDHNEIARMTAKIDSLGAWDIEVIIRQILTKLKIADLEQPVKYLSGGQQKRLALAKVLINEPDLLILDEPTNHLDLDMIEWLEAYLEKTNTTLLMVTHDRYFLDRICDEIIEMENNHIFRYRGNYSFFLEKRDERLQAQEASVFKAKNLLRTEIEWMRRMPQARSHKSKYRIDAFYDLKEKAARNWQDRNVELNVSSARMGNKIVEIENLSKSFDGINIISGFTYKFSRFEKVGLIGDNGTGKTTFLNLITKILEPDLGKIEIGQTIRFGYYKQEGISFNPGDRVIDAVNKIAEYISFEDGKKLSSSQLLTNFLFPPETQYSFIETLSGGEQRRLYLCTVLMQNPNFLILDEPTNDLDIMTLNVLEEYLINFPGCVIVVSHDRFFIDKIVDHLFVFNGKGNISDFPGNYTLYRNAEEEKAERASSGQIREKKERLKSLVSGKPKLSFSEKKEFDGLGKIITGLEQKISSIEAELNSGTLSHQELFEKSKEVVAMKAQLDEKELRWLELSELS